MSPGTPLHGGVRPCSSTCAQATRRRLAPGGLRRDRVAMAAKSPRDRVAMAPRSRWDPVAMAARSRCGRAGKGPRGLSAAAEASWAAVSAPQPSALQRAAAPGLRDPRPALQSPRLRPPSTRLAAWRSSSGRAGWAWGWAGGGRDPVSSPWRLPRAGGAPGPQPPCSCGKAVPPSG